MSNKKVTTELPRQKEYETGGGKDVKDPSTPKTTEGK